MLQTLYETEPDRIVYGGHHYRDGESRLACCDSRRRVCRHHDLHRACDQFGHQLRVFAIQLRETIFDNDVFAFHVPGIGEPFSEYCKTFQVDRRICHISDDGSGLRRTVRDVQREKCQTKDGYHRFNAVKHHFGHDNGLPCTLLARLTNQAERARPASAASGSKIPQADVRLLLEPKEPCPCTLVCDSQIALYAVGSHNVRMPIPSFSFQQRWQFYLAPVVDRVIRQEDIGSRLFHNFLQPPSRVAVGFEPKTIRLASILRSTPEPIEPSPSNFYREVRLSSVLHRNRS